MRLQHYYKLSTGTGKPKRQPGSNLFQQPPPFCPPYYYKLSIALPLQLQHFCAAGQLIPAPPPPCIHVKPALFCNSKQPLFISIILNTKLLRMKKILLLLTMQFLLLGLLKAQVQENEPNNSLPTANPLPEASVKQGAVSVADPRDYFSTTLSADGTIRLIVSGTNTGTANGYLRFFCYDQSGRELLNRILANKTDLAPGASITDTISIYSRGADLMYFTLYADNQPFNYTLQYQLATEGVNDAEPNNSTAEATAMNEGDQKSGHIGYTANAVYDARDYYRTVVSADGTLTIIASGVNTGNAPGYLRLFLYDKSGREILNRILHNKTDVLPGETVRDTISIYSRGADPMYFQVYADNQSFSYNLQYALIDKSPNDQEPNNTTAEATDFTEKTVMQGHIGYTKDGVYDARDYYKSAITADGNLRINISGVNTGGGNGYLRLFVYDKSGRELLNRIVANTTNVPYLGRVSDLINIPSRSGETVYFSVYADNQSFSYQLSYELSGITQGDAEPNNSTDQARAFNEADTLTGNIGYTSNGVYDSRDYYKTGLAADGTIKIWVDGKNTGAANGYLRLFLYDKSGRELLNRILSNKTDVAAGDMVYDTIQVYSRAADSIYFLLYADNQSFNYHLRYQLITLGAADAEPNNSTPEAVAFDESNTLQGHIGYTKDGFFDSNDYYKSAMTDDGTLKIYASGTNTGGNNGYLRIFVYDKSGRELLNRILQNKTNVAPGEAVTDTIAVYSRGADIMYYRVYADNQSFSYQLRYELIQKSEHDAEPNNTPQEAVVFNETSLLKGHIGYTLNGVYDSRDYYKTLLPGNGTIQLMVAGTNTGGANGYLRFFCYDKSGRELLNRIIANKTAVAPGQTITDTINIYSRGQDSVMVVAYADNQSFSYNASYLLTDRSPSDREPNNTFEQALLISSKDTAYGSIGYTTNGVYDQRDYYQVSVPASGAITLLASAKNTGSANGYLRLLVYDLAGREMLNRLLRNRSDVAPGQEIKDTVILNCLQKGNYYVLLYADNQSFSYNLRYTTVSFQPTAAFEYVRTGNTFGFNNQSADADSYAWNMGNNNTNTNRFPPLTSYAPGFYEVKLVAYNKGAAGCSYTDTAMRSFTVRGLEKYTPLKGGRGNVVFNVYGGGLDSTIIIRLSNGSKTYTDSAAQVNKNGNVFACILNMHNAAAGAYDVDIITRDSSYHYPNGFTLEERNDKLRIEIIGRQSMRTNADYLYTLRVHNDGNVNAGLTEVYMLTSDWFEIHRLDSLVQVVQGSGISQDSLPEVISVTTQMGYPSNGKLRGYIISDIPNGGYKDVNFTLRILPHSTVGQINAWVNGPYSGSDMFNWAEDCWRKRIRLGFASANSLLNRIPVVDCGWNVMKTLSLPITASFSGISDGWSLTGFLGSSLKGFADVIKHCGPEVIEVASGGTATPAAAYLEALSTMTDLVSDANELNSALEEYNQDCPDKKDRDKRRPDAGNSLDPNEKTGPLGYGQNHYIRGVDRLMNYNIFFENADSATAPAQQVLIIDTLDKNLFDLSTFRVNSFGIGLHTFSFPKDRTEFVNDYTISTDLAVRPIIKLDTATGILTALFLSIDRRTGDIPVNPLVGFLPPNKTAPEGDGYLNYAVHLKAGLDDGTTVKNSAAIIFDNNEAILTKPWINIIDNNNPASSIKNATLVGDTSIRITTTGTDAASGVENYRLFASENGGQYVQIGTVKDTVLYHAKPNTAYQFYVAAVDSVGNTEIKSARAEAAVTTAKALPVKMLPLTGKATGKTNQLYWTTTLEVNNKVFMVERSSDGRTFTTAAAVPTKAADGNSTQIIQYDYTDLKPYNQTYYRLKQVDADGKYSYSKIIQLNSSNSVALSVYPNPASGNIHIEKSSKITAIHILEITGRTVKQLTPSANGNYNIRGLVPGVYFFEIYSDEGKETVKILVQ